MIPSEGINYLLNTGLKAGSQITTWYVALFEGNYTPVAGLTAASFPADATECVAYVEVGRPVWTSGLVSAGAVDNVASMAQFTFNADKTVYGAALLSVATKGSPSGVAMAIAKFTTARVMQVGDILRVTAPISMTSV